jgi:hypothetical protein
MLTNNTNQEVLDDSFPHEHLFVVSLKTPWFSNIATTLLQRNLFKISLIKSTTKLSKKVLHLLELKVTYSRLDDHVPHCCVQEDDVYNVL